MKRGTRNAERGTTKYAKHERCHFVPRSALRVPRSKVVSAAGLAPAVTRSQAGHVAATPRAVAPANGWRRGLGSCGDGVGAPWIAPFHRRAFFERGTRNAERGTKRRSRSECSCSAFRTPHSAFRDWWSRWVTLPHQLACRASALLVCHDPL